MDRESLALLRVLRRFCVVKTGEITKQDPVLYILESQQRYTSNAIKYSPLYHVYILL